MADEPEGGHEELGIAGLEGAVRIGRGGSATIYRAWQPLFHRMVAIKVFAPGDNDRLDRLMEREFTVMGRLSGHTDVVAAFDGGRTADGFRYLVMPLFGRGSLHELMQERGPLPWREAVFLLLPVADTVADLHSVGIVHRDVKPANILLSDHLRPRLTDFGISLEIGVDPTLHGATVAFTPSFGAPETFDAVSVDTTIDVYSLGATLWALLSGRSPFLVDDGGNDLESVVDRARRGAEPPAPAVPAQIADLIGRSMSANPADRPRSARGFAEQLRRSIREVNMLEDSGAEPSVDSAASTSEVGSGFDRSLMVIVGLLLIGAVLVLYSLLT